MLLKGVNDDPDIMKRLMQKLLRNRVKPYYIYQADVVAGGEHFRTSVQKGIEIIQALRGWTSGLGVPHYVIDAPGGGGKIPILPEYVQAVTDNEVVLRNYAGEEFRYPLPRQEVAVAGSGCAAGTNRVTGLENGRGVNGKNGKNGKNGARSSVRSNGGSNGHAATNGHASSNGQANGNGKTRRSREKSAADVEITPLPGFTGLVTMDL